VPTSQPTTLREAARRYAALSGAKEPRMTRMPTAVLRAGAMFNPIAREFIEMRYQFNRPFIVDSSAAQRTFGLTPTSLDDALRTMVSR
jgi:hypothetical protein